MALKYCQAEAKLDGSWPGKLRNVLLSGPSRCGGMMHSTMARGQFASSSPLGYPMEEVIGMPG